MIMRLDVRTVRFIVISPLGWDDLSDSLGSLISFLMKCRPLP